MFQNLQPLVLASGSPRRREMLKRLGIEFVPRVADCDESSVAGEQPQDYVCRVAQNKALAVVNSRSNQWYLAADTVVVYDKQILGKPSGREEAIEMLSLLAGVWHEVHSAFALFHPLKQVQEIVHDVSHVKMVAGSSTLFHAYVATGEPLDKAGSYAVQGLGSVLIERIEGAYSTVVGLPLHRLIPRLLAHRIVELS